MMKAKKMYAYLAIVIIIIVSVILLSRKIVKIQPISEEVKPGEIVENAPQGPLEQFSFTAVKRPAITVIKPSSQEILTPPAAESENAVGNYPRQRRSILPGQASGLPERQPDVLDNQPPTSVTKIGRQPTEKEKEEMNARGIVMY